MTDFDNSHFLKNLQFLCILALLFQFFRQILQILTRIKAHLIVTVNIVSTAARGQTFFIARIFSRNPSKAALYFSSSLGESESFLR